MISGANAWMLMQGHARGANAANWMRPTASGSLGGTTSGEAAIPFTFPYQSAYRYYLQVQDGAGHWSNALAAGIVVDRRSGTTSHRAVHEDAPVRIGGWQ
jgi:hypothetical protein